MNYKSKIIIKKTDTYHPPESIYNLFYTNESGKNKKYHMRTWEFRLDYIEDHINKYTI